MQINPPELNGSKADEDPQLFLEEVRKITDVMYVSEEKSVELASYKLKDIAYDWVVSWKKGTVFKAMEKVKLIGKRLKTAQSHQRVAYEVELPSELSTVNPIIHVSMLKKHISDSVVVDPLESAEIQDSLSFDEILVEILDFQDNGVKTMANHCNELQDLDLSKSLKLTDHSLYTLGLGYPNLTKLNISGCSTFCDGVVEDLADHYQNLRVLNFYGCVRAATDMALKAIGFYCNRMQTINLGWCDKIGDEGVMSLSYSCLDLRALDIGGCVLITGKTCVLVYVSNVFS
ncbi:F-box/LRR-repeat protein 7-like [Capsicum annuum]|nr:F-box/LRR-repeat protein 7-like [Capsicum annuum]